MQFSSQLWHCPADSFEDMWVHSTQDQKKLNAGDLNTERLVKERRKFFGRLIGVYFPEDDDENDDNEVRCVRKSTDLHVSTVCV